MAYDILIEKRAGTDTEAALTSRRLTALGLSGGIAGIATLLRVSGARAEQAEALAGELASDASVSVSFLESGYQYGEDQIVLSVRNGGFCPVADLAYRLLMLRFPRITSSLRIKEYTVFTLESSIDGGNRDALREAIIGMGRYRFVTEGEIKSQDERTGSGTDYRPKRGQRSLAPRENPELSEPFSTVSSRMVMNVYANRTYEDMKNTATLSARSGERTVYLDADYTALVEKLREMDLVMDIDDANAAQSYFLSESREPTEMELRVIGRCRSERWAHPALNTVIKLSSCEDGNVWDAIRKYDADCEERGWGQERSTLSDLIFEPLERLYEETAEEEAGGRLVFPVRLDGERSGLGINADGGKRTLIFDLESNSTKTSFSPADGAASCLGSVLRRALRLNAAPYEVMRLSGIAPSCPSEDGEGEDARVSEERGRLAREALDSFSFYARTVGVPCSANFEYESDRFSCKHMEVSAALSVSDKAAGDVAPVSGDTVLIFGNRTGRDGRVYRKYLNAVTESVGEAHEGKRSGDALVSREEIAAKERLALEGGEELFGEPISGGNALMQKKLTRICSDGEFRASVKRIREVDPSGLVTAVAAIASGVELYLDCVPVKYNGMSATDVAFSETGERMIAVAGRDEAVRVIELCASYGVICAPIGLVTDDGQLSVYGGGKRIACLSTEFLLQHGSERSIEAKVSAPSRLPESEPLKAALRPIEDATAFQRLFVKPTADHFAAYESIARNCKLGTEARRRRFDSTLSETTGINHMTRSFAPVTVSFIKDGNGILTKDGERLCSAVSIGMHLDICDADPYKGAYFAITEALCRLVAAGASRENAYTAIQTFHPTYRNDMEQTGDTLAAAAGAYHAQKLLGVPAVCGVFSLGGTDTESHRPAVSAFGIAVGKESDFRVSCFKAVGNRLAVFKPEMAKNGLPTAESQLEVLDRVERMLREKKAYSAVALTGMSLAEGVMHMCGGADGKFGFEFDADCTPEEMYGTLYGAIAVEVACNSELPRGVLFGTVTPSPEISAKHKAVEKAGEPSSDDRERVEAESGHAVVDNGEIAISIEYLEDIVGRRARLVYENEPFAETLGGLGFMPHVASAVATDAQAYPLSCGALMRTSSAVNVLVPRFNGSVGVDGLIKSLLSVSNAKVEIVPFDCDISSEGADALAKAILRSGAICIPDLAESPVLLTSLLRCSAVANAIAKLRKAGGLIYGCGSAFSSLIQAGYIGDTAGYGRVEGLAVVKNPLSGLTRMPALIKANSCRSPFMLSAESGQIYRTEISSYFGRLTGNADQLNAASAEGIVPTVYAADRSVGGCSKNDPCGSVLAIDSMTSADGAVMGQLSFPHRAPYENVGREYEGYTALPVLQSIVRYLSE